MTKNCLKKTNLPKSKSDESISFNFKDKESNKKQYTNIKKVDYITQKTVYKEYNNLQNIIKVLIENYKILLNL